jgi:hypothetical protein
VKIYLVYERLGRLKSVNICLELLSSDPQLHSLTVHNVCGAAGNSSILVGDDKRNGRSCYCEDGGQQSWSSTWSGACCAWCTDARVISLWDLETAQDWLQISWEGHIEVRVTVLPDWSFVIMAPMHWPGEAKQVSLALIRSLLTTSYNVQSHCRFLPPSNIFE